MEIMAIDPGPEQSAYVRWNGSQILKAGIVQNEELAHRLKEGDLAGDDPLVIEQIVSYMQAVGKTTFETAYWSGIFAEAYGRDKTVRMPRKDVKMWLCGTVCKVTDASISAALKDRFGDKPTKGKPNPVYGGYKPKKDEWQAWAIAVTYHDKEAA